MNIQTLVSSVASRFCSRFAPALGITLLLLQGSSEPACAAVQDADVREIPGCTQDLSKPGRMKDIVSNALSRGFGIGGSKIRLHLENAESKFETGGGLLAAAALHFSVDEQALWRQVNAFQHVNCMHGPVGGVDNGIRDNWDGDDGLGSGGGPDDRALPTEASAFASDVILHVVLHELGHALVREFDLPILGNEETLADAFATHYVTSYFPERAEAVLLARVQSLMVEAREVPRVEWTVGGEHNSDARRAFQIAALGVAVDAEKYASVAKAAGMSDDEVSSARDYGTEIHRSWRRMLPALRMPGGQLSNEARLRYGESPLLKSLCEGGLAEQLRGALRSFDWHSQVTISFREGEGGAGWSRSRRTITVNSEYIQRFIRQGELVAGRQGSGKR